MEQRNLLNLARILENPLLWAEAILKDPGSGENFVANHVERLILTAKEPRVVVRVHRRAGKSYSLSILALWACMVHHYYDVLIVCPRDDQVSELFETIESFINSTAALAESISEKTKSPHLIKFKNGSTIKGKTTGSSSNGEAIGIKGKGANLVIIDEAAYLADGDFKTLTPIILGDKYKNKDGKSVRTFAASTPNSQQGRYYSWCHDTTGEWREIHVSITDNPDYTEEERDLRRSLSTDIEWITEYLAEFLDSGINAFKNSDIDAAKSDRPYDSKGGNRMGVKRAMGVDWDKYQAGVNICIVEWTQGITNYRLIYREEVPRGEYTLTHAVEKIIKLNEAFQPDHIYVDRGYGEQAVEQLKLYGKKNPSSRLHEKLRGFNFNENVESRDPIDGKTVKKQFKAVMLNTLFKLFEERNFQFWEHDRVFEKQLREYQVIGSGANSIKTTRKNEHIIDACGLACYALHSNYHDNVAFYPARESKSMPAPTVVPSVRTQKRNDVIFNSMQSAFTDKRVYNNIGRGRLSTKEPSRTMF